MSGYRYGGSLELKSEIEEYEADPVLYGGYPFGIPKVYLNGDGEYYTRLSDFDWKEDSVVVARGKHILECMSSCHCEFLHRNKEGESVWVEGRRVANEECEEMEYLNEVRGVKKYTLTEYDLEKGNKRTYSVTLDETTTMTGKDYYRLFNIVDAEMLGDHFEIKDGVLIQYIGKATDLVIPDGVTEIADDSFRECGNFNSVVIPRTVTKIPCGFCRAEHIEVAQDNPKYYSEDGLLIDRETKTLVWAYAGNTIPSDGSVKTIGANAFCGRTDIRAITIPDVVSTIDSDAFRHCYHLKEVKIPDNFVGDARRIFGATLVKDGDKYLLEGGEYSTFRNFSF